MKKLFALLTIFTLFIGIAWSQVFTETMGSGGSNGASIATWETNNYFDNDGLTFSGTGDMRNTSSSSVYTGASGTWNVMLNAADEYLQIAGINSSGYTNLSLSFGIRKSTSAETGSTFSVQVSTDGSTWSALTMPALPTTSATWYYRTCTGSIPASATLYIKFTSSSTTEFRIDDIKLTGTSTGPTITCAPTSLTGFTYVYGAGPSEQQTFSLTGADLTGDITVSIPTPANFEIASASGGTFGSSLTYSPTNQAVSATVYVRQVAGLAIGSSYTGTLTCASSGAVDKTVALSGAVTTPPAPVAPVATAASAIGSNGFTAHWGSVSGATGYYLDVYTQIEGPTTLTEGFNGGITAPSGWTFTNIGDIYSTEASSGVSIPSLKIDATGEAVETPTLTNPSSISFWIKGNSTDAASALLVEQLVGSVWSTIENIVPIPTTEATKSYSLDASVTKVRFTYTKSAGNLAFDDVVIQHTGVVNTYHSQNQDVFNVSSFNVTGLSPETTYYYVIRAYNPYGTSANSNEISATTTAAPSAIVINADGSATGGTVVNGGAIPPSLLGPDSGVPAVLYTVTATGTHDVTVYKTAAFQGDWYCWLNTPGGLLSAANPIPAATAFYTFNNVNFDAKGDVVVILNDNETLPVELSSFTATISAQNFVNLMWTTQSETGVSGFYIYRGTIEDASQAELISPMINATNTSVTHTYLFTDNQLYNDGVYYYWLQNVDFDGTNSFHGPVIVNYSTGTGGPGTPVIPELTELKGIFPNPFNPTAQISYSLKDAASVSIKVYNSRGQIVRSFDNAPGTVGNHRIVWDGRDFRGSSCSTGVYFVRMFAGKEVFTQKAVLVK